MSLMVLYVIFMLEAKIYPCQVHITDHYTKQFSHNFPLLVPPLQWIARRWLLPSPGEGPDESKLDAGFMRHRTASADPPVRVDISVDMDPGYAATARMLLACGRCLVDEDTDPAIPDAFCTPGALFGSRLVPRLEAMGFEFHV